MAFSHSDLRLADQRLAQARERIERQREIIHELAAARRDTSNAEAVFRTMRRTVESFEADRRTIEDEIFALRASH
jgi:hypothetical protein